MNDLVNRQGTAVGAPAQNYFTSYGEQMTQRSIIGTLLKFSKGDWLAGEKSEEIARGTRFIASMDHLTVGWIRWADNKPTDHIMGKLASGYQPPKRHELGDNDKDLWEHDEETGELRDPWQFSNNIVLRMLDAESEEDVYTFATSSKGGLKSLGMLAIKYGNLMRQHPDEWPVVEIGVSAYDHPNKKYGRIKEPTFKIVGWVPKGEFIVDEAGDDDGDSEQPSLPMNSGASGQSKARI